MQSGFVFKGFIAAILILVGLTLLMFGSVLFSNRTVVLSAQGTDLWSAEGYYREFAFDQLRQGRLALWNPYVFSGNPFFSAGQTSLFYPLNLLHLILPFYRAINWIIALNIFLTGLFMALWAKHRGLSTHASALCGALLMFSGPVFLHVFAGHVNNLSAMACTPLMLLAVDVVFDGKPFKGALIGTAALSLQLFAGQPQYTFYTLIMLFVYSLFRMITQQNRMRSAAALISAAVSSGLIAAVQLLCVGLQSQESIRAGGGLPFRIASMLSLGPEQLITLIAPGFFGNLHTLNYWGRSYLWEGCLYIGVTGLVLAVYGAIYGRSRDRYLLVVMTLILVVLAMGANTPLFHFLYAHAPGFDRFRGTSKFIFNAILFVALLAGIGMDEVLSGMRGGRAFSVGLGTAGLLVAGIAVFLSLDSPVWKEILSGVYRTHESYVKAAVFASSRFQLESQADAVRACLMAAVLLLINGAVFLLLRRDCLLAARALCLFALVDVFVFAYSNRSTFEFQEMQHPAGVQALRDNPGEYRILNISSPDSGVVTGGQDVWGYDSFVLKRYAEFIAYSQGQDVNAFASLMWPQISKPNSMTRILRWRSTLDDRTGTPEFTSVAREVMPHLLLVSDYRQLTGRDAIFSALSSPAFNPSKTAILETRPDPIPTGGNGTAGTVELVSSTPDSLNIRANITRPAILLITDSYSRGWTARPFSDSTQRTFHVLPADYVIRAIPLSVGANHLMLEFEPPGLEEGKIISLVSVVLYIAVLAVYLRRSSTK